MLSLLSEYFKSHLIIIISVFLLPLQLNTVFLFLTFRVGSTIKHQLCDIAFLTRNYCPDLEQDIKLLFAEIPWYLCGNLLNKCQNNLNINTFHILWKHFVKLFWNIAFVISLGFYFPAIAQLTDKSYLQKFLSSFLWINKNKSRVERVIQVHSNYCSFPGAPGTLQFFSHNLLFHVGCVHPFLDLPAKPL